MKERSANAAPTGTVTVVLGDVEASTVRWTSDRSAMRTAMDDLNRLVDAIARRYGGTRPLEQGEGDSFVVAFSRASDGLSCVIDIQLALAGREPALAVRMAVHTGEIEMQADGRYLGEALNRCARLRELARGGQTLVSSATYQLAADRLPQEVGLRDLGSHRLRDFVRAEVIYQLCHPDLPDDFPPLATATRMHNLPTRMTTFVGRESELADLSVLIAENRIVTLTGAGGCGKTRLALELGYDLAREFPDGVWWVDLAPLGDPALLPSAVATALAVHEAPAEDVTTTMRRQLGERRLLLVLDNCEHMVSACADLVAQLIDACPGISILATSREPLGVAGESTWRVPSLSFPDEPTREPDALKRFDAVRLFVDRASRVRGPFRLDQQSAAAVASICRRLDGIPLAIELAAARVRVLSPRQIADGLADSFGLLAGGARTVLPRQRTLEASVDWSYRLLDADEQTLLARLSVFIGGFDLDAAEAICSADPIERYTVLDILARLVDKSLVQSDEAAGTNRYRLLDTIRDFAWRRLVEGGEANAMRDRHLAYYLDMAEGAEPELEGGAVREASERLGMENDNLRSALDWAVQSTNGEAACRLVASLRLHWTRHGHLTEGLARAASAVGLPGATQTSRMKALYTQHEFQMRLAQIKTSESTAQDALRIAREIGDRKWEGRALGSLAWVASWTHRTTARDMFAEALALHRAEDDQWALVDSLIGLDQLETYLGNLAESRRICEEALELAEASGNLNGATQAKYFLAWAHCQLGELPAAEDAARQTLRIAEEIEEPLFWGVLALELIGCIAAMRGEYEGAEQLLRESVLLAPENSNSFALGLALGHLGIVELARGRFDEATDHLSNAIPILLETGIDWFAADVQGSLGDVAELKGDREAATDAWERSITMAKESGNGLSIGHAQRRIARIARFEGDHRRAEDLIHEALSTYLAQGHVPGIIDALDELSVFAFSSDGWLEGVRLAAAVAAARRDVGYPCPPSRCPTNVKSIEDARAAVGDEAVDAAIVEGDRLSLEDAIAYARKRRGARKRPSTGWESLTPTELEVARLVAEGLTNPQIAERLFVTRGTVKVHVSHIFTKLGISRRAELASALTRRDGKS